MVDQSAGGNSQFSRRLSSLKREGANVLVLGPVAGEGHAAACRELLGDASQRRRRILVFSGPEANGAEKRLASGHTRDRAHLQVVTHSIDNRSAAAANSVDATLVTRVRADDLAELGTVIAQSIDDFETIADGLDPAELRLCVDSLAAMVSEHGRGTVFRFLHLLTERVRRSEGLAHYHLPVAAADETARMFRSLFDVVVELRGDGDGLEQRWDLGDDVTSEWVPVG